MTIGESRSKLALGGGAALGVVIFLAIVIALQYIILQYPKRWDLTKTGRFTLAAQSKKIVGTFQEQKIPLQVMAFYEIKDSAARESASDLLDQYRDVYKDLSYSFIDPDKERSVALANKVDTYPTLVIKAGQKEQRVTTADEETVTNALMKLLRNEVKKVYLLKGHGELSPTESGDAGFSVAKEEIEKQNYKVEDLVLMQAPAVPDDATILVIAGPKTDPMDTELDSIRSFIKRGGSVLVLLNPFRTPNLAAVLAEYGFETAEDIVVDRMSRALGGDYLMPVITSYIEFPITKNFTLASFFPEVRSVRASKKPIPHVQAEELALTSPYSWTINHEQLKSGNATFEEKTGTKGPIPVMAVCTFTGTEPLKSASPKAEPGGAGNAELEEAKGPLGDGTPSKEAASPEQSQEKPNKARIVVVGSSLFAANKFYKLQGNGDLFMNTVSWLAEDENLIAIRPKSLKSQPVVLTTGESLVALLIPVILVPLAWVIAGIAVFLYRRRTVAA